MAEESRILYNLLTSRENVDFSNKNNSPDGNPSDSKAVSQYFIANGHKKPKYHLEIYDWDLETARQCVGQEICTASLKHQTAVTYLYLKLKDIEATLDHDWVSYGVNIGSANTKITPLDLVTISLKKKGCPNNERLYRARPEHDTWIMFAVCAHYSVRDSQSKQAYSNEMNEVLRRIAGATIFNRTIVEFKKLNPKNKFKGFKMLISIIDMFLAKFPNHRYSVLRNATMACRFKDCELLDTLKEVIDVTGIERRELLSWAFEPRTFEEAQKILNSPDEFNREDSYLYYLKDLELSIESPYKVSANCNLYLWLNWIGCAFRSSKCCNAKTVRGNNVCVPISAVLAAYAFEKTGRPRNFSSQFNRNPNESCNNNQLKSENIKSNPESSTRKVSENEEDSSQPSKEITINGDYLKSRRARRAETRRKSDSEESRKSDSEESRKSDSEESRKSDSEASRKSDTEASRKSGSEASRKSGSEASRKSDSEASRKSDFEASRKSDFEASRKSDFEASRKSDTEASRKSDTEASRKSDTEASRKSDTEASRKSDTEASRKSDTEASRKSDSEASRKSDSEASRKSDSEASRKSDSEASRKSDSEASRKSDSEASRKSDSEASRKGDSEASRKGDSEASRKSDSEASRKSDSEASRKSDSEASRKIDSEASRKSDSEASRKSDSEASRKSDSEASRKIDSEASRKIDSEASRKSDSEASRKSDSEASRKSDFEESRKSDFEESRKSDFEASRKSDFEASRKSDFEASRKSDFEASRKSDFEASRKSDFEASRKSDFEASRKSDFEASRKSDFEASRKSDFEASRKSDFEASRKSDFEASRKSDSEASRKSDSEASKAFRLDPSLTSHHTRTILLEKEAGKREECDARASRYTGASESLFDCSEREIRDGLEASPKDGSEANRGNESRTTLSKSAGALRGTDIEEIREPTECNSAAWKEWFLKNRCRLTKDMKKYFKETQFQIKTVRKKTIGCSYKNKHFS